MRIQSVIIAPMALAYSFAHAVEPVPTEQTKPPTFLQRSWESLKPIPYDPTDPTQFVTSVALFGESVTVNSETEEIRYPSARMLLTYAVDPQLSFEIEAGY